VQLISNYLANSGGKRMRPILTILSAKMFGYQGDNAIKLAAAVEFIHMATLLHDDVVDGSKMRRFLPSANVVWGNKASILVGDFLFSQSFKLMVSTNSLSALGVLANAATIIAEGEVAQLAKLEAKTMLTIAEYNKIVNAKTAELFASACQVGGIISEQSDDYNLHLRLYGLKLGYIFQIVDDLLDYDSDTSVVGKNIGDDFREGKVTLPVILLFAKLSPNHKDQLLDLFFADTRLDKDFIYVQSLIKDLNIKAEIIAYLNMLKIEAAGYLDHIKVDNKDKDFLKSLIDFAIARSY
jgi:octaprenyl-diphosphate synthase